MNIPSEHLKRRRSLLLVCFVVAAILIFQAIRIWVADYRVHKNQIDQIERGISLEPENASAWDRLGRARETDLVNPDPAGAVGDFQKAVARVPLSATYWMDLAGAYESIGNIPLAREAFSRARAAYPASAVVAWSYGNFLLRQGDDASGFAQINHAVQADPSLALPAVSQAWHKTQDANVLLNQVLPATQDAYFQAIDFMAANGQPAGALVIWARLLTSGKPFELQRSVPLLEFLIQTDRAEDASRVWRDALIAAGLPHNEPANQSLIWNGDFARDFLNGGLDWRWSFPSGTSIGFDTPPPSSGGRSLQLDFSGGANLDLTEPREFVPVEPSRSYHFHATLRTEGITSESGISFLISDPNHGAAVLTTENLTGSHPWTPVDVDFATAPVTHFLLVQLRRSQSRQFENKLSGTAWIGDVSLTPNSAKPLPTLVR
jgi:tetratricopeptide (TPR) repeat protein